MQHQEIEYTFTNIEPKILEQQLIDLGAEKQFDMVFESVVFDYPDFRLNEKSAWVRLRKEGEKIMLAYKERLGVHGNENAHHDGTKEIEFGVTDFEAAIEFMKSLGLIIKYHQEKRRIRYTKDGVEFDIDFWPYIDPILEIESDSEEKIDEAAAALGFEPEDKKSVNSFFLYKEAGIDLLEYEKITFSELKKREQ
ncbi:CYTH domain-containing protein [Candidatus Nomurabacteria bacterium]|nr:CYTH domain-containing protein [Candidatus Nomurabacteria bacterium]